MPSALGPVAIQLSCIAFCSAVVSKGRLRKDKRDFLGISPLWWSPPHAKRLPLLGILVRRPTHPPPPQSLNSEIPPQNDSFNASLIHVSYGAGQTDRQSDHRAVWGEQKRN